MKAKNPFWIQTKQGRNGRWYWTMRCYNGRIVADCAQGNGYSTESNAIKSARNLKRAFRDWPVPIFSSSNKLP